MNALASGGTNTAVGDGLTGDRVIDQFPGVGRAP